MAEFVRTILASSLPPNSMKSMKVDGKNILLINANGQFYGMDAMCKHDEWDLSEGTLSDTTVTCAGHGAKWNFISGLADFSEELPPTELYDVKVEDGYILVKIKS